MKFVMTSHRNRPSISWSQGVKHLNSCLQPHLKVDQIKRKQTQLVQVYIAVVKQFRNHCISDKKNDLSSATVYAFCNIYVSAQRASQKWFKLFLLTQIWQSALRDNSIPQAAQHINSETNIRAYFLTDTVQKCNRFSVFQFVGILTRKIIVLQVLVEGDFRCNQSN